MGTAPLIIDYQMYSLKSVGFFLILAYSSCTRRADNRFWHLAQHAINKKVTHEYYVQICLNLGNNAYKSLLSGQCTQKE